MKTEYTVVAKYRIEDLMEDVTTALKEGWVIAGGVSVCYDGSNSCYHQALVRYTEDSSVDLRTGMPLEEMTAATHERDSTYLPNDD